MNGTLKSHLIMIAFLIVGLLIMGTTQLLKMPLWLNPSFMVLLLFVVVNFATAKIFRLNNELRVFWSLKKIYYLPLGIAAGGLIAAGPVLAGLLAGKTTLNELTPGTTFSISSIMVTLAIVAWEELWFRGIFLNHCNKNLSAINISVTTGILFMLVHLLNPEINLLKTGPALFFAGALLTIVYFYFKTIWLPVGMHFGNNYLTLQSKLEDHWFLGNEGYFGAIILAVLFLIFVKLTLDKTGPTTNKRSTSGRGSNFTTGKNTYQ